jgi:hypothetical protein
MKIFKLMCGNPTDGSPTVKYILKAKLKKDPPSLGSPQAEGKFLPGSGFPSSISILGLFCF